MSLANNDPEIFERLGSDDIIPFSHALVIPHLTVNSGERLETANRLRLLLSEEHGKLAAYVLLKQAEAIIAEAIDIQKEDAIAKAEGKKGDCLGAKYELKGVRKWEYEDSQLYVLEQRGKDISEQIKARKRFLESLTEEIASTQTGEITKPAKLIQDGITIAITLLK